MTLVDPKGADLVIPIKLDPLSLVLHASGPVVVGYTLRPSGDAAFDAAASAMLEGTRGEALLRGGRR